MSALDELHIMHLHFAHIIPRKAQAQKVYEFSVLILEMTQFSSYVDNNKWHGVLGHPALKLAERVVTW